MTFYQPRYNCSAVHCHGARKSLQLGCACKQQVLQKSYDCLKNEHLVTILRVISNFPVNKHAVNNYAGTKYAVMTFKQIWQKWTKFQAELGHSNSYITQSATSVTLSLHTNRKKEEGCKHFCGYCTSLMPPDRYIIL